MAIVVIHGPQASGKTFHADRLQQHYGCAGISDGFVDGDCGAQAPRDGDLVLTNLTPTQLRGKRGRGQFPAPVRLVSIHEARAAIGVGPVRPLAEWRA